MKPDRCRTMQTMLIIDNPRWGVLVSVVRVKPSVYVVRYGSYESEPTATSAFDEESAALRAALLLATGVEV